MSANYVWPFSNGFPPGSRVLIEGCPTEGASDPTFSINFLTNLPHEGEADIAFHINVRYGAGRIINNSYLVCGGWQEEERHETTSINEGRPFKIIIVSEVTHFSLFVNGHHFTNFLHRMPLERLECLSVGRSVNVTYMAVDKIKRMNWPLQNGFPVDETITIKGVPGIYKTSREFSINVQTSLSSEKPSDIIFSMLARFMEREIIISTYESDGRRDEKVQIIVLLPKKEFVMEITNSRTCFEVKVYADKDRDVKENFVINMKTPHNKIMYLIIQDNIDVSSITLGKKKDNN